MAPGGVRSLAFVVALGAVWAGVNGLWFLAGPHVGAMVWHPTGSDLVSGGQLGIEASTVAVGVWLIIAAYLSWMLVRYRGVVQPAWIRHKRLPGNPALDTPAAISS